MQNSVQVPAKIGFVSLGCPKALVDSERIMTQLRAEGYQLVPSYQDAQLVIVNTCGFITSAVEESLAAIEEALNENGKVIVTGCLGAKPQEILTRFPQVLKITGPHAYDEVVMTVHEHLPPDANPYTSLLPVPPQGIKLTPKHYAYLKISEGCNHKCTFCIIPDLRGKLQSRLIGDVMAEASRLKDAGVKELLVISQDTSAYGVDVRYRTSFWDGRPLKTQFYDLVQALGELGIWVRLHYVYPYPHVDAIIPLMAENKILPYLDIPFQHASRKILQAMKRPANSENTLERIAAWRKICPELTIRSTFIVGFPGETDADFQELLDFLTAAQLDRVGCFQYSPVDGAVANSLTNPVNDAIKQERYDALMSLQATISQQKLQQKVGKSMTVLIDAIDEDDIAIARSTADAPEIDGAVYIQPGKTPLKVGEFAQVTITDADEYDLWGEIN